MCGAGTGRVCGRANSSDPTPGRYPSATDDRPRAGASEGGFGHHCWLRLAMSRGTSSKSSTDWDPAADDAFRRTCAFPARGIGGALFGRLRDHAAEQGFALAGAVATLPATPTERQRLAGVLGVAGEIADGIAQRKLGPADALRLAAEASEIAERLADDGKLGHAWAAALCAAEQAGSVAAYCDSAALGAMPGEAEAADAVQVM